MTLTNFALLHAIFCKSLVVISQKYAILIQITRKTLISFSFFDKPCKLMKKNRLAYMHKVSKKWAGLVDLMYFFRYSVHNYITADG